MSSDNKLNKLFQNFYNIFSYWPSYQCDKGIECIHFGLCST